MAFRGLAVALCGIPMAGADPAGNGLPRTIYEEWRISPSPVDMSVPVNPPPLLWASVKRLENRDVTYRVDLSMDPGFPEKGTRRGEIQRACFHVPHRRLEPGKWFWRYEIIERDGRKTVKGPYRFEVGKETPVFESPTFAEFLSRVPKSHPRVITQGKTLEEVRKTAATHPLAPSVIAEARKAASAPVYDGPVHDEDLAEAKRLAGKASREVKNFDALVDGYVLSGDPAMKEAILKRLEVLLGWPTDDLLGSQVLTAVAKAYDALHGELTEATKQRMLEVIRRQLRSGLSRWPGLIEARQVENHFWQMELAGNFTAALATVHELEESREMLAYTYGLFLARFPNLATDDGGWAEGHGYFGVNHSAVVDMAVLMKKVAGVDVFKSGWYRNLADYFIYFAPAGGQVDGFGDMHERVGRGLLGASMMLVTGIENQDPKALYRAAVTMKPGQPVESWYQIVNDVRFNPADHPAPAGLPQARLFAGTGLAALHTDVLKAADDTAVYFRSSPFGAKGHMHANQNAFNLSRGGEPLFYSGGYYTTFADPHSLSSYRHTRAHNAILVNGCGQAFGHEGYGWIKRYLQGHELAYVCGDATAAYQPTVDGQFLGLLKESGIAPIPENGHGDGKLALFERHLLLVRPDTVVVYDVLEGREPSDWSLLLHAGKSPEMTKDGSLRLATSGNRAWADVFGSQKLQWALTDRFHSPPIDIKKKFKATPNQYHASYQSTAKSGKMRFLTVIRMSDATETPLSLERESAGVWRIGGLRLEAELDVGRPARLSAVTAGAQLHVNAWPEEVGGVKLPSRKGGTATLLLEKPGGKAPVWSLSENMAPAR